MCAFKLGSIAQELDIDYSRNDGKFAIFVEDVNWNAEMYMRETMATSNMSSMDPLFAFYHAVYHSMGNLFRFELSNANGSAADRQTSGKTSISMPFIQTVKQNYVIKNKFISRVVLEVHKIMDNKNFYQHSLSVAEAGWWICSTD
jgi:hypothetical protein